MGETVIEVMASRVCLPTKSEAKGRRLQEGSGQMPQGCRLPAKADMSKFDTVTVVAILTYLVILVTMVVRPIAAMLVEMFPTRIRYTSMSCLPHRQRLVWRFAAHHGVCHRGADRQHVHGLWKNPIISRGMTFVVGMLFVRETKDVDIYAND